GRRRGTRSECSWSPRWAARMCCSRFPRSWSRRARGTIVTSGSIRCWARRKRRPSARPTGMRPTAGVRTIGHPPTPVRTFRNCDRSGKILPRGRWFASRDRCRFEKGAAMATKSLFRHILVPHDFSDQATVALQTAGRLAKEHGGKLTVLHVLVPFYMPADVPFGMPAPGDLIPQQRQQLQRLGTKALGTEPPPVPVPSVIGDASQCIIDV